MDTYRNPNRIAELRYALEVLDEYSHLGLDEDFAGKIREVLSRQIEKANRASSCRPIEPIRFPISDDVSA